MVKKVLIDDIEAVVQMFKRKISKKTTALLVSREAYHWLEEDSIIAKIDDNTLIALKERYEQIWFSSGKPQMSKGLSPDEFVDIKSGGSPALWRIKNTDPWVIIDLDCKRTASVEGVDRNYEEYSGRRVCVDKKEFEKKSGVKVNKLITIEEFIRENI